MNIICTFCFYFHIWKIICMYILVIFELQRIDSFLIENLICVKCNEFCFVKTHTYIYNSNFFTFKLFVLLCWIFFKKLSIFNLIKWTLFNFFFSIVYTNSQMLRLVLLPSKNNWVKVSGGWMSCETRSSDSMCCCNSWRWVRVARSVTRCYISVRWRPHKLIATRACWVETRYWARDTTWPVCWQPNATSRRWPRRALCMTRFSPTTNSCHRPASRWTPWISVWPNRPCCSSCWRASRRKWLAACSCVALPTFCRRPSNKQKVTTALHLLKLVRQQSYLVWHDCCGLYHAMQLIRVEKRFPRIFLSIFFSLSIVCKFDFFF